MQGFWNKCVFAFHAEIQDGRQKCWGKTIFEKNPQKSVDTPGVKNFIEIALSHTASEISAFLRFKQKFKMATKNGRKTILGKVASRLCIHSWG